MENICKKYWELIHHIGKILAEEDQVHFDNFIEEVKKLEQDNLINRTKYLKEKWGGVLTVTKEDAIKNSNLAILLEPQEKRIVADPVELARCH